MAGALAEILAPDPGSAARLADEFVSQYRQERWKGITPVLWGDTLREAEYMQKVNGNEI